VDLDTAAVRGVSAPALHRRVEIGNVANDQVRAVDNYVIPLLAKATKVLVATGQSLKY